MDGGLLSLRLSLVVILTDLTDAAGADDFLPVLIYVVIHANPPQLASNLEYIQRFRMHSRMASESAYFFTQLVRALCQQLPQPLCIAVRTGSAAPAVLLAVLHRREQPVMPGVPAYYGGS